MPKSISINKLLRMIRQLPEDPPIKTKKWYLTQKEHWIGWLSEYHGPGFYGRKTETRRDAQFAYNHIVEPKMLLWLIGAAGVDARLLRAAKRESASAKTMIQASAAIRRHVTWEILAQTLWPEETQL